MKKLSLFALTTLCIIATTGVLDARGGGGGGGGGGGRSMSRSPSMSRSTPARSSPGRGEGRASPPADNYRPRGGDGPRTRPEPNTPIGPGRPAGPNRPVDNRLPAGPNRPVNPGASRPAPPTATTRPAVPTTPTRPAVPANPTRPAVPTTPTRPAVPTTPTRPPQVITPTRPTVPTNPTTPSRPGGGQHQRPRPGESVGDHFNNTNRPGQGQSRPVPSRDRYDAYRNYGNTARVRINNFYPDSHRWFNNDFWTRHNYTPYYYHHNIDWWRPATVVGLGAWLGWTTSPTYIYYSNDGYYSEPSWYGSTSSAVVYPSTSSSSQVQDSSEWMPLGVFALTKSQEIEVTPKFIFQLVLSKTGAVAGTFYNTSTDETYPLEGAVDPVTQRIAWKIKDNATSPIIETGLYNLSEEQTPVRLSFTNGTQQDMLLVRLPDNGQ